MTTTAETPTREPIEALLTGEQQASMAVRREAATCAHLGVPLELALAEVRFGYRLAART